MVVTPSLIYMDTIKKTVENWINKISVTQKNGKAICPFAKKSEYKIFINENKRSLKEKVKEFDEAYDLYICVHENQELTVDEALSLENELNSISENTIVLLDHFKDPGFIENNNTSNEKYVIFLVQNKKKLLKARNLLHNTNYYSNWSKEYYKKIIETGT